MRWCSVTYTEQIEAFPCCHLSNCWNIRQKENEIELNMVFFYRALINLLFELLMYLQQHGTESRLDPAVRGAEQTLCNQQAGN